MSWEYYGACAALEALKPWLIGDLGLQNAVAVHVSSEKAKGGQGGICFGRYTPGCSDIVLYATNIWDYVGHDARAFVRRMCVTIAHELRHAWQDEQSMPYDHGLPYAERPSERDARDYAASVMIRFTIDVDLIVECANALHQAATQRTPWRSNRLTPVANAIVVEIIEARRWTGEDWRYWRDCVKARHDRSPSTVLAPEAQHAIVPHGVPP